MAKRIVYLQLYNEIREHGETQTSVAELLGISLQTMGFKLTGKYDWTIGEIETLCKHYNKNYYELFRKEK